MYWWWDLAETIREAYGDQYKGVPIRYAYQLEQRGLVHAIHCARKALGQADFWLFLGDEVLEADHQPMLDKFTSKASDTSPFIICGLMPSADLDLVRRNYSLVFAPHSETKFPSYRVTQLVEKPERPFNAFIGTGHCVFQNEALAYIDRIPPGPRTGRKELAGLIQYAIDQGEIVLGHAFPQSPYGNINTYEDYVRIREALIGRA